MEEEPRKNRAHLRWEDHVDSDDGLSLGLHLPEFPDLARGLQYQEEGEPQGEGSNPGGGGGSAVPEVAC